MPAVTYQRNVSFDEYLRLEEASEERHEYVAGRLYAMAGGTANHNIVTSNLHVALYTRLKSTPCRAFRENMKLRIRQFEDYRAFYPDVFVACNPQDKHPLFRDEPRVIIEVLSDGTRGATSRRSSRFTASFRPSRKSSTSIRAGSSGRSSGEPPTGLRKSRTTTRAT
jgi:Uma2 family endonuclease